MLCGPHDSAWHSRRAGALLKIMATTICGSDLHVLKGDVPSCAPGRILGHEAVGEVCCVWHFILIARTSTYHMTVMHMICALMVYSSHHWAD